MGFDLRPSVLLTNAIVLLVAMVVHEYAHARVAYEMGDPTARDAGRMTLDPRANINLVGYILGVVIGFGVLGSAPVNPYRMRDPRWGMFYAVLAGPISNLLVAIVFAIPLLTGVIEPALDPGSPIVPSLGYLLHRMVLLNVLLFIFNLLPFFPLDGWTIVLAVLPARASAWWQANQQTNIIIGVALLAFSFIGGDILPGVPDPLTLLVFRPSFWITGLLGALPF